MLSHPDANAFLTRLIAEPADTVIRSVFADWLDEQGGEANENWAKYIRLRTEASARHGIDRDLLREDAANIAPHLKARLTVPASKFAPFFVEFLDVLPPDRLTVSLGSYHGPVHPNRTVGEEACRRLRAVVVAERDNLFAVVSDQPDSTIALEFGHLLQGGVVQFPTSTPDLTAALARQFPKDHHVHDDEEPEPEVGPPKLERLPVKEVCRQLVAEAQAEHARGIEVMALPETHDIRYLIDGRPLRRHSVPAEFGAELVERFVSLGRRSDSGLTTSPRNSSFGAGVLVTFNAGH